MAALPEVKTSVTENWIKTHMNMKSFSYKWIITNFSMRPEKHGEILKSPTFSASHYDQYKWCLQLYPNGNDTSYRSYMGLFLELTSVNNSSYSAVKTNFNFSILNDKSEQTNIRVQKAVGFYKGTASGNSTYIARSFVLDKANGLLPDDTLTIICHITTIFDTVSTSDQKNVLKQSDCERKLLQDFSDLLEDTKFKDVTFIVGNSEIQAHKNILAARSIVFDAMFGHEMIESKLNRVSITDFSYEVIQEMLRFIYTGKVLNLDKMADELLIAAEKYALEELKELCELELCGKITVKTAADMLIFADLYRADNLKLQTIEFINAHAPDILETECWKNMFTSHKHLIMEAVEAIATWNGPPRKRTKN